MKRGAMAQPPTDFGPAAFDASMLLINGPFAAYGEIIRWHFQGDGDTEFEYGTDLPPSQDVLKHLQATGIGLYCISNRCRSRYLTHKHQPTLVAVIVGTSEDHRHFVSAVMLNDAKRQSSKRLTVKAGRDAHSIYGPGWTADRRPVVTVQCPRCRARGTIAAANAATM